MDGFRKVLAQYHAVCVADYEGYIIFVDSDIRFTKAFDESFLDATTKKKAISYFKGTRLAAETGFVVINNNKPESKTFFDLYLKFFISGEFRKLERWDDGFVFDYLIPFNPPEWFHDFAEGNDPIEHVNSNGHEAGGQIMVTNGENTLNTIKAITGAEKFKEFKMKDERWNLFLKDMIISMWDGKNFIEYPLEESYCYKSLINKDRKVYDDYVNLLKKTSKYYSRPYLDF